MSTETIAVAEAVPVVPEVETNEQKALKITRRYVLWSMGGGLIPVAFVNIAAVIGVQIKMLHEISKVYGVEFKENRVKSILIPLIGSIGLVPLGTGVLFGVMKAIPVLRALAATISIPISAGAVTYATGKIFISHFESGGTFLNFNPEKMKAAYRKVFDESKEFVSKTKKEFAK